MQRYYKDKPSRLKRKRSMKQQAWVLSEQIAMTKSHFVQTLIKYSKLYCKYTKLAGFRYFVESKTTWFDR